MKSSLLQPFKPLKVNKKDYEEWMQYNNVYFFWKIIEKNPGRCV